MDYIMQNSEIFVAVVSLLLTWVITRISKVQIDRTKVIAILNLILDLCQDIANGNATKDLPDAEKKALAVAAVVKTMPAGKQKLIKKVFGTVGGAVEFAWKNRKSLGDASAKLVKAVFRWL